MSLLGSLKQYSGAILFFTCLYGAVFSFGSFHTVSFCLFSIVFCKLYLFSNFPCPPQQKGSRIPALFLLGSALLATVSLISAPREQLLSAVSHSISFIVAWSVFSYIFLLLAEQKISYHHVLRILSIGGMLTAAIALWHFPQDNGLLFNMFSPEFVFVSQRARWPFVNPNHLGHFLILSSMITWADLYLSYYNFLQSYKRRKKSSSKYVLFTSERIWKRFRVLLFLTIGHSVQCVALLMTFSRSAYLGYALSLALSLLLLLLYRAPFPRFLRVIYLSPFLIIGLSSVLFSNIGGLFIDRFFYVQESLQQDIRGALWQQSMSLLTTSNWSGLAPGGWRLWHVHETSQLTAYFDPRYLHSDPLQYIIEYGFPGAVLLLTYVVLLLYYFFSSLRKESRTSPPEIFLFSSLIGIGIASCFDFPFHVPAIQWWTVCVQGLLFCLLYWSRDSEKKLFNDKG